MSIFTKAFNKVGGYSELGARFPGGPEPQGARWERRCVQFGRSMRYDWCVTITVWQPVWDAAGPLCQAAWQTAR